MSKIKELNESLRLKFIEMAVANSNVTGIPGYSVYISVKQGLHGSRVKIYKDGQIGRDMPCVSMSIEQEPEVKKNHGLKIKPKTLSDFKLWVSLNRVDLDRLWKYGGDYKQILKELVSIKDYEKEN